jgi:hypothetical protein
MGVMNAPTMHAINSHRFTRAWKLARVLAPILPTCPKRQVLVANLALPSFKFKIARKAGVNMNRPVSDHCWKLAVAFARRIAR